MTLVVCVILSLASSNSLDAVPEFFEATSKVGLFF